MELTPQPFCWYKNAPGAWLVQTPGECSLSYCEVASRRASVPPPCRRLSLDAVEQLSQRDVDSARHLLPFEGPDVVHGLGDEVVCQLEGVRDVRVGGEGAHQRARVLVGDLIVVFDIAEHESHHGLGLEGG